MFVICSKLKKEKSMNVKGLTLINPSKMSSEVYNKVTTSPYIQGMAKKKAINVEYNSGWFREYKNKYSQLIINGANKEPMKLKAISSDGSQDKILLSLLEKLNFLIKK